MKPAIGAPNKTIAPPAWAIAPMVRADEPSVCAITGTDVKMAAAVMPQPKAKAARKSDPSEVRLGKQNSATVPITRKPNEMTFGGNPASVRANRNAAIKLPKGTNKGTIVAEIICALDTTV